MFGIEPQHHLTTTFQTNSYVIHITHLLECRIYASVNQVHIGPDNDFLPI